MQESLLPKSDPSEEAAETQVDESEPLKGSDYLQPEEPDDYLQPEEPDELEEDEHMAPEPGPEVEPSRGATTESKLALHGDTVDRIKSMCMEWRKDHEIGGSSTSGKQQKQRAKGKSNAKKQNAQTPFKLTVLPPSSNKRW